jgi:D-sedoheptulose 7-phosphate isomerase
MATALLATERGGETAVPHDLAPQLLMRAIELSEVLTRIAADGEIIARAAAILARALDSGQLALICGNGGSAADAQHFAGELVGRFRRNRTPWPALALTADTALITAIANDFGFEEVYERQVIAYGRPGDVFIGFSTSGRSPNVIRGARAAKDRGLQVIAFTGMEPNELGAAADIAIAVPSRETALIQEAHAVLIHVICEFVEAALAAGHD